MSPTCLTALTYRMSGATAQAIHNIIVMLLACGHPDGVPPVRLHIIKSCQHPHYADKLGCQDPDCLYQQHKCLGNR